MDRRARAALISIGANLGLVCLKLLGAWLSLSMAMRADAIHSLSDVGVSVLVLCGVLFSNRHARWLKTVENCIALVISFLILGAALGLLIKTFEYRNQALTNVPLAIVFVWVCIFVSYAIARYKIQVGRECDSAGLEADGYHSKMDMYSSVAVLIGLLGYWTGFGLDALASAVVVLLILKVGIEVLFGAIQGLLQSEVFTFEALLFLREKTVGGDTEGFWENGVIEFQARVSALAGKTALAVRRHRHALTLAVALLAVAGYIASGLYRIQPDEIGVILHFGELRPGEAPRDPGLHWRLPSPFTTLCRVKPGAVRQLEFGFRTIARRGEVAEPAAYLWESLHQTGIYKKVKPEAIMLTGDKNEVDVNLAIEYCAADGAVADFLFSLADTEAVVRAAAECCIRCVVGEMYLNDVLTTERKTIERRIAENLQQALDVYRTGVAITAVHLQDVHPPIEVVPAFRRVATAREEKVTQINRAIGYQKAMIPQARGGAEYILADAEAYRMEKQSNARGEAAYFSSLADAFREAPEAVAFLMHMDTLETVLPRLRKVFLSGDVNRNAAQNPLASQFMMGEFLKRALDRLLGIVGQKME